MRAPAKQIFLGIAGGSASGKSTLARYLQVTLGEHRANLISLDWYYRDNSHLSVQERAQLNYDHPTAFDFGQFASDLNALKKGEEIVAPEYDFSIHCRSSVGRKLFPKQINIVEGILVYHDKSSQALFDLKVFVDAPTDVRLSRRIARDTSERGRTYESVVGQWNATVEPMYQCYCEPTRDCAQIIISGTVPPATCTQEIFASIDKLEIS